MFGTMFCQYETPCGWCVKFDKRCTEKKCRPKSSRIDYAKALQEKKDAEISKKEGE